MQQPNTVCHVVLFSKYWFYAWINSVEDCKSALGSRQKQSRCRMFRGWGWACERFFFKFSCLSLSLLLFFFLYLSKPEPTPSVKISNVHLLQPLEQIFPTFFSTVKRFLKTLFSYDPLCPIFPFCHHSGSVLWTSTHEFNPVRKSFCLNDLVIFFLSLALSVYSRQNLTEMEEKKETTIGEKC